MQTKLASFIESAFNLIFGYLFSLLLQMIILPWFVIDLSFHENLQIGALFTVASTVRHYLIRRVFNRYSIVKRQGK